MSDVDFGRVKALLEAAWERPEHERMAFVAEASGGDELLRAEVESLLLHGDDDTDSPIDGTAPGALLADALEVVESVEFPDAHPERIGPYRVTRRIAVGGMGAVYEAEQDAPRRRVAVKVMRADVFGADVTARFAREAEILGRLHHAGIAHVHDAGTADIGFGPQPFFAMEFVEGLPLTAWCDVHDVDTPGRLELVARIADAVDHAHGRGIVHRDLKPDNVLVTADGEPKILDFGVARATDADIQATTLVTAVGQVVGTLPYMAPEQVAGDVDAIDARTDVYALGVILYELLAGHRPHDVARRSMAEAARIIREEDATRLGSIDTTLRGDVDVIVGKALEKDRRRRYRSAAELAADIRRHLRDEPIEARAPSTLYQVTKFARRHRGLVAGIGVAFVALAVALVVSVNFALEAQREAKTARRASYRLAIGAALSADAAGERRLVEPALVDAPETERAWEWHHIASRLELQRWETSAAFDDPLGDAFVAEQPISDRASFARRVQFVDDDRAVMARVAPSVLATWDATTGERLDELEIGIPVVDGKWSLAEDAVAAITRDDGRVIVVERATGERRAIDGFERVAARARSLAWSADGRHLAVVFGEGFDPGALVVGSPGDASSCVTIDLPGFGHAELGFVGDLLVVERPTVIAVIEPSTGRVEPLGAERKDDRWYGLALGAGVVVAPTTVSAVDAWDLGGWRLGAAPPPRVPMARHAEKILHQAAVSADGRRVVTAASVGELRVFDRDQGRVVLIADAGYRPSCALSRDGARLAVLSEGRLRLWDVDARPFTRLAGHASFIYDLDLTPDGRTLISRDGGSHVKLWDTLSGELLVAPRTPAGMPFGDWTAANSPYHVSADGRLVGMKFQADVIGRLDVDVDVAWLAEHDGREIDVVKVESRVVEPSWFEPPWTLASSDRSVSPDGRWIFAEPLGRLLDADSGEELWVVRGGVTDLQSAILESSFAPDSARVAFAQPGAVTIHAVPEGDVLAELALDGVRPYSVAWSPDGRRVVTGGSDGILRLWDGETYELVASLKGHGSYVHALAWTPDGTRLFSAAGNGALFMWDSIPRHARYEQVRARDALVDELRPQVEALLEELGHPRAVADALAADASLDDEQRHAARRALRPLATAWWTARDDG